MMNKLDVDEKSTEKPDDTIMTDISTGEGVVLEETATTVVGNDSWNSESLNEHNKTVGEEDYDRNGSIPLSENHGNSEFDSRQNVQTHGTMLSDNPLFQETSLDDNDSVRTATTQESCSNVNDDKNDHSRSTNAREIDTDGVIA